MNFSNSGTVDVRSGTISFANSFTSFDGTVGVGISSLTSYGKIVFSDNRSTLNGAISARLLNGYVPAIGNTFQPLSYRSVTGRFASTNLPKVAIWNTVYGGTGLTITVMKLVPTVIWANPTDIVYGTPLGTNQQNAGAASPASPGLNLAGTFSYNPPRGTRLSTGSNQVLSATFTPTDTARFAQSTGSVSINVLKAPVTISSGIAANNKVYDGTTTTTISSNNVMLLGIVSGDIVSLRTNGYAANFASTGIATSIPVTVSGLTLNGSRATNYILTQPTGLTASITATLGTIRPGVTGGIMVTANDTGEGVDVPLFAPWQGIALGFALLSFGLRSAGGFRTTRKIFFSDETKSSR